MLPAQVSQLTITVKCRKLDKHKKKPRVRVPALFDNNTIFDTSWFRKRQSFLDIAAFFDPAISLVLLKQEDEWGKAMATAPQMVFGPAIEPELHSGDRMTRKEFHRTYEKMPEDFKAEPIGGAVYVASTLKRRYDTDHLPPGHNENCSSLWNRVAG